MVASEDQTIAVPLEKALTQTQTQQIREIEIPEESVSKDEEYLSGYHLYMLIAGLGLTCFLMALDSTIIATAIPSITARFNSTKDIGWYGSAYFVTICSLQPTSGKLYANFSLKWTFLVFFGFFLLGSLICGAATSSSMLIVGRAIAGAGGSGLMTGSMAIIAAVVRLQDRSIYIGIMSAIFNVASITGPLIGGALTDHVTWRWIFYINLPLGLSAVPALIFLFHPPTRKVEDDPISDRLKRLDFIGAALFIPGIVMLLLALQWGGTTYAWKSATIIGLFVGFGCIMTIFAAWQIHKQDSAMLPPSILTQRTVLSGSIAFQFGMGAMAISGFWLPAWFQVIKGVSATRSGVLTLGNAVPGVVVSLASGIVVNKIGYFNPAILFGSGCIALGVGLFSTLDRESSMASMIGYQVIYGLGCGPFATTMYVAVQTVLRPDQIPVGISIIGFFQFLGGSIWVAISQLLFTDRFVVELGNRARELDSRALLSLGITAITKGVTPEERPVVREALNAAITSIFCLGAAIAATACVVSLGMEWKSVRTRSQPEDGKAGSESVKPAA